MRVQVKGAPLQAIDYHDFKFRVNLKNERQLLNNDQRVIATLKDWNKTKKTFRFIKRFTFTNPNFPLKVDFSIVKSSRKRRNGQLIPEYTVEQSKLFKFYETYEIEIEMDNEQKGGSVMPDLIKKFKTVIKYILSGLQETNFPISYDEQDAVLQDYLKILHPN